MGQLLFTARTLASILQPGRVDGYNAPLTRSPKTHIESVSGSSAGFLMYRKSGVMAKTIETCQPDLDTRTVGFFWPDNPGDDIVSANTITTRPASPRSEWTTMGARGVRREVSSTNDSASALSAHVSIHFVNIANSELGWGERRPSVRVQRTVTRAVVALCGEKMINNRKGCTQWVTKAARGIRTRVRNRRK